MRGGADFFRIVRQNVVEGFLSDPSYGGNFEMAGWRWVGYPGVASAHGDDYRQNAGDVLNLRVEPRPLDWWALLISNRLAREWYRHR